MLSEIDHVRQTGNRNFKPKRIWHNLRVDVHSHLLPGLDDGPSTLDDAMELIYELFKLGFKKLILTPHIMSGFYDNSLDVINYQTQHLQEIILKEKLKIEIEIGAEYYLDDNFTSKLENSEELIGLRSVKSYILFETSFIENSNHVFETVGLMKKRGYIPLLAHTQRYSYLIQEPKHFDKIKNF